MGYWTKKEETWLIENYQKFSVPEIATQLNKSYDAVRAKANKLNISRDWGFKLSENKYIKAHYIEYEYSEIAKHLGRTTQSVCMQAKKLGLVKSEKWQQSEIDFIKANINLRVVVLAEKLNRPYSSTLVMLNKIKNGL